MARNKREEAAEAVADSQIMINYIRQIRHLNVDPALCPGPDSDTRMMLEAIVMSPRVSAEITGGTLH